MYYVPYYVTVLYYVYHLLPIISIFLLLYFNSILMMISYQYCMIRVFVVVERRVLRLLYYVHFPDTQTTRLFSVSSLGMIELGLPTAFTTSTWRPLPCRRLAALFGIAT